MSEKRFLSSSSVIFLRVVSHPFLLASEKNLRCFFVMNVDGFRVISHENYTQNIQQRGVLVNMGVCISNLDGFSTGGYVHVINV